MDLGLWYGCCNSRSEVKVIEIPGFPFEFWAGIRCALEITAKACFVTGIQRAELYVIPGPGFCF